MGHETAGQCPAASSHAVRSRRQREISARIGNPISKRPEPPVHPTAEHTQQPSAMYDTSVGTVTRDQRQFGLWTPKACPRHLRQPEHPAKGVVMESVGAPFPVPPTKRTKQKLSTRMSSGYCFGFGGTHLARSRAPEAGSVPEPCSFAPGSGPRRLQGRFAGDIELLRNRAGAQQRVFQRVIAPWFRV